MKLSDVRWLNVAVVCLIASGLAVAFFGPTVGWHEQTPLYCILAAAVLVYLGKE